MEQTWYEFSPFLYAVMGVAALILAKGLIAVLSGVLLLAAAATILRLRWSYRRGK